jgi:hypothetical protein
MSTNTPQYIVVKEEYKSPCEHPLCDQLHRRFFNERNDDTGETWHETKQTYWSVIDTHRGLQAHWGTTKKECVREAEYLNKTQSTINA